MYYVWIMACLTADAAAGWNREDGGAVDVGVGRRIVFDHLKIS